MKFENIVHGVFLSRPNRFIAKVLIDGREEICHVKNTGRCGELFLKGADVILQKAADPSRKTAYDLIAVYKGDVLVNVDSQAPNKIFGEYLRKLPGVTFIRPETKHGDSRFDFYFEIGERKIFAEVKGVTLEKDGAAMFPDAPTERGVKHLNGLIKCIDEGYEAWAVFVIKMKGVSYFTPNRETHKEFAETLKKAEKAGVKVLAFDCLVTEDTLQIDSPVEIKI